MRPAGSDGRVASQRGGRVDELPGRLHLRRVAGVVEHDEGQVRMAPAHVVRRGQRHQPVEGPVDDERGDAVGGECREVGVEPAGEMQEQRRAPRRRTPTGASGQRRRTAESSMSRRRRSGSRRAGSDRLNPSDASTTRSGPRSRARTPITWPPTKGTMSGRYFVARSQSAGVGRRCGSAGFTSTRASTRSGVRAAAPAPMTAPIELPIDDAAAGLLEHGGHDLGVGPQRRRAPGGPAAPEAGKVDRGHRSAEGLGEQLRGRLPRQGVGAEPVERGAPGAAPRVRRVPLREPLHRVHEDAVDLELVRTARVDRCAIERPGQDPRGPTLEVPDA